jgi:hypothetical protein
MGILDDGEQVVCPDAERHRQCQGDGLALLDVEPEGGREIAVAPTLQPFKPTRCQSLLLLEKCRTANMFFHFCLRRNQCLS